MKCPFCVAAGLSSKVYVEGPGISTDMAYRTFYDEDGVRHCHNLNWHIARYSCSALHVWSQSLRGGCCEDDPREERIRRDEDRFRCGTCNEIDMHDSECPEREADTKHRNQVVHLPDYAKPWLAAQKP